MQEAAHQSKGSKVGKFFQNPGNRAILSAAAVLLLLIIIWLEASHWYQNRLLLEVRAQIANRTYQRANALSLAINRRFAQLQGLYAFVDTEKDDPNFETHFASFADGLLEEEEGIRNLAVAPGGVMRYVYPQAENTDVIGYEPLKDTRPDIREDTQRAMESGHIVVSGPFELLQGGMGLIARKAVYQKGAYWGLVNVVLDFTTLLEDSGLNAPADQLDIALRNFSEQVIYGSADVFDNEPVIQFIELPEGAWELAAIPAAGWQAPVRAQLRVFQVTGLLIAALIAILVYLTIHRQVRLERAVQLRTKEISAINQQLEQRVADRTRELSTLYVITSVASESLDLEHVMQESLTQILALMQCEIGSIHLLDEASRTLRLAAVSGLPAEEAPENNAFSQDFKLARRVFDRDSPMVVPAIERRFSALFAAGKNLEGHAFVGAPMHAKGETMGVLSVVGPVGRQFSPEEVSLLVSIADQVGTAVENAQLFEQAETLAVIEERQRLAREMHDTLAQGFTGINIQLEAVESALELQQDELAMQRLSLARDLANQSLAEARRSVWALQSKSLEEKKLTDALQDSVRGLTAGTNLSIAFDLQDGIPRFPIELETDLLRVIQEAVMNVVKHAQANHLRVCFRYKNSVIELRVEDDGCGFEVGAQGKGRAAGDGFGLTAMRERATRHGGSLSVKSEPQRGTKIIARIMFDNTGA